MLEWDIRYCCSSQYDQKCNFYNIWLYGTFLIQSSCSESNHTINIQTKEYTPFIFFCNKSMAKYNNVTAFLANFKEHNILRAAHYFKDDDTFFQFSWFPTHWIDQVVTPWAAFRNRLMSICAQEKQSPWPPTPCYWHYQQPTFNIIF